MNMNSAPLTINETSSLALPTPVTDKIVPPPTYTVMELFAGGGLPLWLGFWARFWRFRHWAIIRVLWPNTTIPTFWGSAATAHRS